MATEQCSYCKGWINTASQSHHVITLQQDGDVFLHSDGMCYERFETSDTVVHARFVQAQIQEALAA